MSPETLTDAFATQIDTLAESKPEIKRNIMRITKAYEVMETSHTGQTRRLSGDPYTVHPLRVALTDIFYSEQQKKPISSSDIAADLLHDVVEDTAVTLENIENDMGSATARKVDTMTKPLQIEEKKEQNREAVKKVRSAYESGEADALQRKVMDRMDTIRDRPGVIKTGIFSSEQEKLKFKNWRQKVKHTKDDMIPNMVADQPELQGILFDAITVSRAEIHARTQESKKKQAA